MVFFLRCLLCDLVQQRNDGTLVEIIMMFFGSWIPASTLHMVKSTRMNMSESK